MRAHQPGPPRPGPRRGGPPRAAVISLAGLELAEAERDLLARAPPAGIILFARNCRDRRQIAALVAAARAAAGDPLLPFLIDQEGGRVRRLRPPEWRELPAMSRIGGLAEGNMGAAEQSAWLAGRLIAHDLAELGVGIACAPVLDVRREGTTEAIGDRAFGADPLLVAWCGRALARGLLAGGVLPVMKHIPGHGAARLDSHIGLPVVGLDLEELTRVDFAPFRALRDLPLAMTAHVVYSAIDPAHPATLSPRVIGEVIRGDIGFKGLLFSDDIGMGALSGPLPERAAGCIAAGCDVALYCSGDAGEAECVLQAVPELAPERYELLRALPQDPERASMGRQPAGDPFTAPRAADDLTQLLGTA